MVIEKEWAEVLTIINGKNQKKVQNPNGKYPIYGSGGIMDYADDYLCEANTTIIGRKGSINNPMFIEERFWNVDTAFGLNAGSELNDKYLYYFCKQYNFLKHNKATTLPSLTKRDLLKIKIPLPKSDLQNKTTKIQDQIVEVLDRAVALRDKTKRLLEEYDQLAQSVFLEMFGDPMNNNKKWHKKKLKQLGKVITGSTPSSRKQNMFNGPIPFVTPSDLDSNENYSRSVTEEGAKNSRIVNNGALLVCCIGSTIGKRRMVQDTVAFNQQINAIQWNNLINPYYGNAVFNWLKQEVVHRAILTTVPILKKSLFEEIECPVPPIDLQTQFAQKIELIEKQKEIAQQELQEAEDLFQALLQKAFKGELVSTIPEKV